MSSDEMRIDIEDVINFLDALADSVIEHLASLSVLLEMISIAGRSEKKHYLNQAKEQIDIIVGIFRMFQNADPETLDELIKAVDSSKTFTENEAAIEKIIQEINNKRLAG